VRRPALELMNLHVAALFTYDERGRMLRSNEPSAPLAPRFFLGLTKEGLVRRYRNDVDEQTILPLESVSQGVKADNLNESTVKCCAILETSGPIQHTGGGPAYSFPESLDRSDESVVLVTAANQNLLSTYLPEWLPDVTQSAPLFACVVDDRAVAVCGSVRITPEAHEAGVETAREFRGHGYAVRVVLAWAHALRELGVEALYSTELKNASSQAVARKLRLIQFGLDVSIT